MPDHALDERITQIIEPSLSDLGYELVRVRLSGSGRGLTLQVMAERADRVAMTVDHCAEISRTISALLDIDDPIDRAYDLEVSSPGLDRPLTRPADFERFAGFEAKVDTTEPVDGRKRFRGRLLGLSGDRVRLALADGEDEAEIGLNIIDKAKLVITDELLTSDLHASKAS